MLPACRTVYMKSNLQAHHLAVSECIMWSLQGIYNKKKANLAPCSMPADAHMRLQGTWDQDRRKQSGGTVAGSLGEALYWGLEGSCSGVSPSSLSPICKPVITHLAHSWMLARTSILPRGVLWLECCQDVTRLSSPDLCKHSACKSLF